MTTLEHALQDLFKPGPIEIEKLVEKHFEGNAEQKARLEVEFARATFGPAHPDYAIHLNNLAGVVRAQGRYGEAETLYRQALEIGRATIGEGHPDYAIRLSNLAGVLVRLDRAAEARPLLEQALAIFRATLPADHPHIGVVERRLAALADA